MVEYPTFFHWFAKVRIQGQYFGMLYQSIFGSPLAARIEVTRPEVGSKKARTK